MRINLGCGKNVLANYENYDLFPVNDKIKKIDLRFLPLPFDTNSVDEVLLDNVIEHISDQYDFMMDVYRILKPGGVVKIVLPGRTNTVSHVSQVHSLGFFACMIHGYGKSSSMQSQGVFYLVKRKGHLRGMRSLFYMFFQWVSSFLFEEVEWELKK